MAARRTRTEPESKKTDPRVAEILAIAKSPGDPSTKIDRIIALCSGSG